MPPSTRAAALAAIVASAAFAVVTTRPPAPGAAPAPARPAADQPAAAALLFGGCLDINRADAAALVALPGIGPARAAAILAARAARGGRFTAVDDLSDVPGIGARTLARLRPLVTAGEPAPVGPARVPGP